MSQSYRQAIAEGKRLYAEAMDKAANYALYISEQYDRRLQTVCKEIAEDGWNALRNRAQRLEKTAGQTPDERARATLRDTQRKAESHAKAVLKDPEQAAKVIASLSPTALDNVYHEAKLIRAGEDRSPAARKAAEAGAHNALAPIRRAVATMDTALCVQALDEAADHLRGAMAEDTLTSSRFDKIDKAFNRVAELIAEARFSVEATV